MIISVLISIVIAIVVGVNVMPLIFETVNEATAEGAIEEGSTIAALAGILPYIFVAVIIIGAVAFIGSDRSSSGEERRETIIRFIKNPKEVILRIERSSKKWEKYLNNLDALLGIKTVEATSKYRMPFGYGTLDGLLLTKDKELYIDSLDYDWYLEDKSAYEDVFKIVGLHKSNAEENKVYLLGVSGMERVPFLTQMSAEKYLEASCESLIRDSRAKEEVLVA